MLIDHKKYAMKILTNDLSNRKLLSILSRLFGQFRVFGYEIHDVHIKYDEINVFVARITVRYTLSFMHWYLREISNMISHHVRNDFEKWWTSVFRNRIWILWRQNPFNNKNQIQCWLFSMCFIFFHWHVRDFIDYGLVVCIFTKQYWVFFVLVKVIIRAIALSYWVWEFV